LRVYKELWIHIREDIKVYEDSAYIGLKKYHKNTIVSKKKKSKKKPFRREETKQDNMMV
jgi:hypothetical protein